MRKTITLFFVVFAFLCSELYSQSVTLLGNLNPYPGTKYADIWGYTDVNNREYAIMGVTGGTSIIDVTDAANPVEVSMIPGPNSFYEWRDMKTHSHYAYIVTEGSGSGSGMQIIDLSQLPDTATLVNTYTATFVTAHNIYIDNGYAYVVGANNGSGVHILDLSDPVNPVEVGYYGGNGYVHDIYVYNDTAYVSSEGEFGVVDVTNKSNPINVSSSATLPGIYAHSGWLTEDKRYFIACEEFNVRDLTVWDLQDRSTWDLVVPTWQSSSNSPIHNVFVLGNYAHISYYEDGYVVLDISNPLNPVQVGQYDTDPTPSNGSYKGAWGCYPYLPSGNVLISDMQTGLYILKFDPMVTSVNKETVDNFQLEQNYPNPFNPSTKIKFTLPENELVNISVFNSLGEKVKTLINKEMNAGSFTIDFSADRLPSGIYIVRLQAGEKTQSIKMSLLK